MKKHKANFRKVYDSWMWIAFLLHEENMNNLSTSVNSSLEWRRSKVQELASQGYNQSEISRILLVDDEHDITFAFRIGLEDNAKGHLAIAFDVS